MHCREKAQQLLGPEKVFWNHEALEELAVFEIWQNQGPSLDDLPNKARGRW